MKSYWKILLAVLLFLVSEPLLACPSCKAAIATDNRIPLAYQLSILFMLTVIGSIATTISIFLYRLNKAQVEATEAFESGLVWEDPS